MDRQVPYRTVPQGYKRQAKRLRFDSVTARARGRERDRTAVLCRFSPSHAKWQNAARVVSLSVRPSVHRPGPSRRTQDLAPTNHLQISIWTPPHLCYKQREGVLRNEPQATGGKIMLRFGSLAHLEGALRYSSNTTNLFRLQHPMTDQSGIREPQILPDWLPAPIYSESSRALTLVERLFGCMYVSNGDYLSRYKISHSKIILPA